MTNPLTDREVEILRQYETAGNLRDLKFSGSWQVLKELAQSKIQVIRERYEGTRMDKDATWLAHANLLAIKEFWNGMELLVEQSVDLLDPEAIKRMVEGSDMEQ